MVQITAVLCVRDEGAFLLDWMAHHLACGVTHVVAASNACSDGTDLILDRLQELGLVTHLRNDGPYHDRGIQFTALKQADRLDVVKGADWVISLDVDEFINVHVGARRLTDLIAENPEADALPLTWRLFGNAGVVGYEDQPVPQRFTNAAQVPMAWPWRAAMFKTLYRPKAYRALGVHRPRQPVGDDAIWIDGNSDRDDALRDSQRVFTDPRRSTHRLVQLNHYPLSDMQSYILKTARGRAVHSDHALGMDYWVERNFAGERDETILRVSPLVARVRETLAQDATLAELHSRAVAWRHARFDDLMRDEAVRALYGRLQVTPPSVPLSEGATREMMRFALGSRKRS